MKTQNTARVVQSQFAIITGYESIHVVKALGRVKTCSSQDINFIFDTLMRSNFII